MRCLFHNGPGRSEVLALNDFAAIFGTSPAEIPGECRRMIKECNFRYRKIAGPERDRILLDVLKRIDSGAFSKSGKDAKARWEKGWSENRDSFIHSGGDLSALVPKYIRPKQPVRLYQNYVEPEDPQFEYNWYQVFSRWLFKKYLADCSAIYEFGCGPGHNLAVLAELYPDRSIVGLDWASASQDIIREMSRVHGWRLEGRNFDFFSPDRNVIIAKNSVVLTIGGLEQTGSNHGAFIEYLLAMGPKLVIHIEPICEWYAEDNLLDYAAMKYHRSRNYLEGLPELLKRHEDAGRLQVIKRQRSYFGSLYHDGYSQLIWKPIEKA